MPRRKGKPRTGKPGRPPKWTQERKVKFLEAMRQGNTRRASCLLAGFSEDTLQHRVKRDTVFAAALKQAEAEAEAAMVSLVRKAAPTTWQAAAWWLERKLPADWSLKNRHEHSGPGGGPIPHQFDLTVLSDEELEQFERSLSKVQGG